MNPSRIFIERPVATSLLMIATLLTGIVAFTLLPLSALPQVDYPTIQVQTFLPGASPEVMTSSVTAPLERQLGQMPGLTQMSSASSAGASIITLQFDLDLSLDIAEQQVQAAINAAGSLLPSSLPAPPIYAKFNPADAPILTLAVTSKTLPLREVQQLVDTRIAQKIAQLPGVGVVSLSGGQRPAVRIRANPRALAAYGLNIDDLRSTISNANVNTPNGNFDGPSRAYTINSNGQLKSAEEYRNIVIAYRSGAAVRLGDVADILDGAENDKLGAWMDATPSIIINVRRQPSANVIQVADQVKAVLPRLQDSLPTAVEVHPLTDRTVTIRASVHSVQEELLLAIVLVVAVIFVFLRNLPATLIPSLSVPLSLIGTFGVMYLLDFSLNNLTLMALTIATGFVVDDAIVMIENISRYVEKGEDPRKATLKGSEQIAFTIMSLTASLVAVLIPLLFMGDVVGRLFRQFAITLAVTILISAVVSLTVVPMLCARLLKPHEGVHEAQWSRRFSDWFNRVVARYGTTLNWVLDRQGATLIVFGCTLMLTAGLYILMPKGFFPEQDTGLIEAVSEADQSVSFAAMSERQQALAAAILKEPDVKNLSSFIGIDASNITLNSGRMLISLKPHGERDSVSEVMERLSEYAATVPGVRLWMRPVQDLTIETTASRTQYQFLLQAPDPALLAEWAPKLVDRLRREPALADVASNLQTDGLAAYVEVDRDAAARFGISLATVDNALYSAFGQRMISTIYTQSSQSRVILEADPSLQLSIDSLGAIYLPSSGGGQVPLSSIADIQQRRAPLQIDHVAQFPSATISFNVAKGSSLGAGVDAINAAQAELGVPDRIVTSFQGAALAFTKALTNQLLLILAAVVTVYIILGVLYESFIHPITILSTLPSAGMGALLALLVFGHELDIIGIIGIILLIGLVKKNAIMMIDFALSAEREEGKPPREAITQACLLRFRPILMTTMAAMLGALPLMVGWGVGSELRHPLGISIFGGLIVSQLLTLYTTPVIYLAMDRLSTRLRSQPVDRSVDLPGGAGARP